MKVLIVTDTFPPEKVGSYRMYDLSNNLIKDGFHVTVLCPPPTFPFGSFKRTWKPVKSRYLNGFKVVNLWTWQPQSKNFLMLPRVAYYAIMPLLALMWISYNRDFDAIITSTGTSPLIWFTGLVSKRLFKKHWLVDVRDLPVDSAISLGFLKESGVITSALRAIEYESYTQSDYVVVPTRGVQNGILRYNIDPKKIFLVHNAADIDLFHPIETNKKRQIVFAGNIGLAQDFDCVLTAMKKVANHNLGLTVIGEGEAKERLRKLISINNLDDTVLIVDGIERSKLPSYICEFIAGIAPLKNVGAIAGSIPAKVFDYMACAIPFIAFGGDDLKKMAEDSGAGFVIPNDPDILANSIIKLAQNPSLCDEMGSKGRKYCEKYFNRKAMAKKVELLISSLNNNCL